MHLIVSFLLLIQPSTSSQWHLVEKIEIRTENRYHLTCCKKEKGIEIWWAKENGKLTFWWLLFLRKMGLLSSVFCLSERINDTFFRASNGVKNLLDPSKATQKYLVFYSPRNVSQESKRWCSARNHAGKTRLIYLVIFKHRIRLVWIKIRFVDAYITLYFIFTLFLFFFIFIFILLLYFMCNIENFNLVISKLFEKKFILLYCIRLDIFWKIKY